MMYNIFEMYSLHCMQGFLNAKRKKLKVSIFILFIKYLKKMPNIRKIIIKYYYICLSVSSSVCNASLVLSLIKT